MRQTSPIVCPHFFFVCVAQCVRLCTLSAATYCNRIQLTATHTNTLKHTAALSTSISEYVWTLSTATHCNSMQLTATHCNSFKCTAAIHSTYTAGYVWTGHAAAHCNSLQLTVTHCTMHIYRKRVDIILPKRAMFAPSIWRDVVGILYHQDPKAKTLPFRL